MSTYSQSFASPTSEADYVRIDAGQGGGEAAPKAKEKQSNDSNASHVGIAIEVRKERPAPEYYYGAQKVYRERKFRRRHADTDTSEDPSDTNDAPIYPEDRPPARVAVSKADPDNDNLMIYIILGYITGIVLVLFWHLLHHRRESAELNLRWFLIVLLGLLLLIIFYSHSTRCVGILALTLMCSYKGRALLVAFAFILATLGPVTNIMRNIEIVAQSLSCGQTLLRNALTPMHEIMGEPVYVVEQAVYTCLSQVRKLMERLDAVFHRQEVAIVQLHAGYKGCDQWLILEQTFFDNQMGSPHDRCLGASTIGVQDCMVKFAKNQSICDLKGRFAWFCENLKDLPSFFDIHLKEQEQIVDQVFGRPLEIFARIRAHFEVSITFDHSAAPSKERGALLSDLDQRIAMELERETKHLLLTYIWLDLVIITLLILIFVRAIYFRMSYLGSDNYRNFYLTKEFYAYNKIQLINYANNALPLRSAERNTYVKLSSFRLVSRELLYVKRSLVFLIIISLQLFIICFVDYSIFWMLAIMSFHSHKTAELQPPAYTKIVIRGGGLIGDILRGLVHAFEPLSKNLIVDIQHCLPLPRPPKFLRYWEIMMLCILAWCLLFWEPYGRRLRHKIMASMYPHNASVRAAYLHRCLLLNRDNFIKIARRKARSLNYYYSENSVSKYLGIYRGKLYKVSCGYSGTYKGKYCIICIARLTSSFSDRIM
ncbi:DC-STAMP domain-containing protein 2-like isoform X2 [Drosophila novamexicana]|uniref:DC-STAMP domain-containing protein 2-like isoform X2 n=1 Tax=Drosophila novamexicana TaxID=47314 RepID=UPI0011E5E818|nr:DC-STAMP domain-containing protein 2-like isoform X2 [Drosophila novamexicana]